MTGHRTGRAPAGERNQRPPTGSDVARAAGVSKSAVSRAFTGGLVAPEVRARILEAARRLKYRPSLTARSLVTSQSRLIGLAITHLENQFYPEVVERLSDRFAAAGYRLVLFVTRGTTDLEPVIDELLGFRLDGVVLASSSLAARVAAECLDVGVPVVMFNNVDPLERTPGVCADNVAGAMTAGAYLLAAGHRRFGVVTGLAESTASTERSAAFSDAIAGAGASPPVLASGDYSFDGAVRATRSLLALPEPPDAIFCVNDHMALAACQAARLLGYEPGRHVSVVGFDNAAIADWPAFRLTTYAQPVETMIEMVADRLLDQIAGRGAAAEVSRVPGRLIVRDTARPAPGTFRDVDGVLTWRPA